MIIVICEQFCDTGLTFWQDKHCQNLFATLDPVTFVLAVAPASQAYVERAFSVCGNVCRQV